jgi:hypothetical protein
VIAEPRRSRLRAAALAAVHTWPGSPAKSQRTESGAAAVGPKRRGDVRDCPQPVRQGADVQRHLLITFVGAPIITSRGGEHVLREALLEGYPGEGRHERGQLSIGDECREIVWVRR